VSPASTRVPFTVLCGAPARWRTATTGPKQMMSLPARNAPARISAAISRSLTPGRIAARPASLAASLIRPASRM
jgi:hypothetical protein